ncbi:glycerophosphodiester phosphodiesterase [Pueribacillus sp. YX66]|uniref:glycerophosphodiester phosphodiesterase n=1 Tax=Pueribacillus sp. YX66 TaxID=3229242 RepID=UPI00358D38B1
MTLIFAHRGASYHCPENTMASFMKAAQLNADGIELDVQLSSDHIPVVIHDFTLHRTTSGYGNVNKKTVVELKTLDAGGWFSPTYQNETIPTLNEVLRWAKNTKLLVNIELKSRGLETVLEKKVCELIEKHQFQDRVIISSFWKSSLEKIKEYNTNLQTALLIEKPLKDSISFAKSLHVEAIHPNYKNVTKNYIDTAHCQQLRIRPYTVNDKKKIVKLFQWNVDAIITDRPDIAIWLRNNLKS